MRNANKALVDSELHWIGELEGAHAGQMGFVLGNGWSMQFYDPAKMREEGGVLFGCNFSFHRYPVHYLVWQDSKVHQECSTFDGIKLLPRRKGFTETAPDNNTSYYFGFGKPGKYGPHQIRLMHSGGMALQLAIRFGCNPIVLVGCDCRIFDVGFTEKKYGGRRSNIFRDKMAERQVRRQDLIQKGDKFTTSQLEGFAKKFEYIYNEHKDNVDIYQLGSWSIMDTIPCVEWEEYWSDEHPEKRRHRK